MIKVLELIDGGFIGGGQTHILSLVSNLDKDNFHPIIAGADGAFKDMAENSSFRYITVTLPKFYRVKHLRNLLKVIGDKKIDLVHSHGGVAGIYSRMAAKHSRKLKVIHTIHGIHYTHKNFFIKFVSHTFEQYLVPFTNRFICVSDNDFIKASKLGIVDKHKTVIIKNGIDLDRFSPQKDLSLTASLGIKKDDIVLGNISRFDYQKNQRLILKAASEIIKSYSNIKILFVGDGEYKKECEYLAEVYSIKDNVIFTGEVTNTEKYYPLIDIFIFPSLWEGLSITLIEAMAAGKCIIASKLPENKELVKDNYSGLLFDLDEGGSLAERIRFLLENKDICARLSENAFKESSKYDEKTMAKKIENVYYTVMKESHKERL